MFCPDCLYLISRIIPDRNNVLDTKADSNPHAGHSLLYVHLCFVIGTLTQRLSLSLSLPTHHISSSYDLYKFSSQFCFVCLSFRSFFEHYFIGYGYFYFGFSFPDNTKEQVALKYCDVKNVNLTLNVFLFMSSEYF